MGNQNYKISIILPVYNVERYLSQCVDSIFEQTLPDIEVIAVNDGSTDQSLKILEKYQKIYPDRVKIYSISNSGVSHARNYGIDRARGEFILFVDSDDFLELDMCEKLFYKAKKDGNDIVICGRYNVYEKEHIGQYMKETAGTMLINRNFKLSDCKFELAHISPFPWDKLFKRELLSGIYFPENLRFEDLVFSYEAACKAECIGVVEEPLYNYRRTRQGGFLNSFTEQTLDITRSFDLMFDYMKKNGYWETFHDELEYICTRHLLFRYGSLFKRENKGKLKLKKQIIRETQDFLDDNLPNWRKNHYLRYSAAPELKKKLKLYTSRGKLLRMAFIREYTPNAIVQVFKHGRNFTEKWKRRIKKWNTTQGKLGLIANKFPLLTYFKRNSPAYYIKMFKKLSVAPRDILLESKHGEDLAGNIFALMKELSGERYASYRILLVMKPSLMPRYKELMDRYGIHDYNYIPIHTRMYLKALASAKYLVTDTSFPPYYIKRDDQILLNTWHGTPLKAMGRIVPSREYALGNIQRNFLISDYLLYQNEFSRDMFQRDYMLDKIYPGTVLTCGYPRNSVFLDHNRYEKLREEIGMMDKQIIVYMPTWRGLLNQKENSKQIKNLLEYFHLIDVNLNKDQVFYVKLHPYVKDQVDYEGFQHIREFPKDYETYDFLNACDVLVTDYSSIMFDFGVTKRKMVLFVYDREEYLTDRGLYLNLEELDLPKVETVPELIEEINRGLTPYPEFFNRFCSKDSADTPAMVCELLINGKSKSNDEAAGSKEAKSNDEAEGSKTAVDGYSWVKVAEPGNKKKVFIFINGMKSNDNARRLVSNINSIDSERYDVFVCVMADKIKNATQMLSTLKKEVGYFPITYNVDYTPGEYIRCKLLTSIGLRMGYVGKGLQKVTERELKKYFGTLRFDIAIHHTDQDYMVALMCQSIATKSIYNFKYFDFQLYKKSQGYRRRVRIFLKLFNRYDAIVATKEYKQLHTKAKNIILNEDAIFPMPKILTEVDN
ncbi:MAG TPA: CDP-glycerol glycerophosphotransferase family protein [Mobilitalea sp.]|nr:CDP-glycerol glycerophosphotransferase family protein [Mobilitalea sp.]